MPTPPTNETHHRDMAETAAVNAYSEEAARRAPHLTAKQSTTIGAAMFQQFKAPVPGISNDVYFEYLEKQRPELFRTVPDRTALTIALAAKLSPTEQITIARRVERMSADELLAASEGLDLKAASKVQAAPDTRTPEQRERQWTPEDMILNARGIAVDTLDPHKRIEYRNAVARENTPPNMSAVDEVRHLQSLGVGHEPSPMMMMTADRQARAAGMTLAQALAKK